MISQEFTAKALNRLRRPRAQLKYITDAKTQPKDQKGWDTLLTSIQNQILDDTFRFRPFNKRKLRNGKLMFSTHSLENIMVMRKINDNIRRAYRVKQASRFDTIRQIRQALRETTPKHLIRLDIRSFYESVPRRALIEKIRSDRLVSTRTLDLLRRLLRVVGHSGARGLPRGLQISATLAELHAAQLERDIRSIEGVYYVARYVDDVVIFSYTDPDEIYSKVLSKFKDNKLLLNPEKTSRLSVQCRCAIKCIHNTGNCSCATKCKCTFKIAVDPIQYLDFLGYRLAFPDVNARNGSENDVRIYMADKKIVKYKSRIHATINEYLSTNDFSLLRDRILFLTGNHRLESSKIGGSLRSGIFYNFDLYCPFDEKNVFPDNRLEHLDSFLTRSILRAFSISPPPSRQARRNALSMSFANGHRLRRMRKLTPARISEVGRCWRET